MSCLDDLISELLKTAKFLPFVQTLKINYTSQNDGTCFAEEAVEYDEIWLSSKLDSLLTYWNGKRNAVGVDIEDAWKCQNCHYADECSWRKAKSKQLAEKNHANNKINCKT